MFATLLTLAATGALINASPTLPTKRWNQHATCRDFYADITASANNSDIGPIIGGM